MRFFSSLKIAIIIFSFLPTATPVIAQTQDENFTIESYYKVKGAMQMNLLIYGKRIICHY